MYAMSATTGKQCGKCGYDLTGLEAEGLCPECGEYRDAWSGKGIASQSMVKHQRGEWVVRLLQVLGLVFLSMSCLGLGSLYSMKASSFTPLFLTGLVALMFLVSAVVLGVSLFKSGN